MVEVFEGAEAWSADGDDVGALVLHGFTGNPVSMRPLAEALADAGRTVELPRLPGHGTSWQALQRTTWRDWVREAVAGLERLRSRSRVQVVVGLSMGGTLALHLAATRGEDLAGAALINPALRARDPRLKVLPVLKWVVPGLPGIGNDIAKEGGDEKPYEKVPLKALSSFLGFQGQVRRDLARVRVPLLVLTSRTDHVVDPENSQLVLDGVSSTDTRQVWLERSYHVATLDHDFPVVRDEVLQFVDRVAGRVGGQG